MKTHLPKGLRAALMAALAFGSFTSAYAAEDYTFDWNSITLTKQSFFVNSLALAGNMRYYPDTYGNYVDFYRGYGYTPDPGLIALNQNGSSGKNTYIDLRNTPCTSQLIGVAWNKTINGDVYIRSSSETEHKLYIVTGVETNAYVKKDFYLELNDASTYGGSDGSWGAATYSVMAVRGGNVDGKSTVVITKGTYGGIVTAGIGDCDGSDRTIKNGTYLQIDGGTFNSQVAAGNFISNANKGGQAKISGGTHLLIRGGTFNDDVQCGSRGAGLIEGGVHAVIEGGTFNNYIFGCDSYSGVGGTTHGGIEITISGGTFNTSSASGIYAAGYTGTVGGNISLTLQGDTANFADNYVISAGNHPSGKLTYESGVTSTVTLKDILRDTKNTLATNSSIKVDGGQQKSKLVMDNVGTTIQAKLNNFTTMTVTNGSNLTLTHDTNATLGGVSEVVIDGNSTLSLEHAAGQTWNEFTGSIDVKSGSTLHLSGATNATLNLESGSTLSVKEGDLFAGQGGSSIPISGATLKADEGNWTLNKAATVAGATVKGTHAVAFGSEVDSGAVVTMSGTINATEGNLILKNTTVAANTTATLSGNITFEGVVDNKGELAIKDGSFINIDEQSLIRNAHFVHNGNNSAKNGYLADNAVLLAEGGTYSYNEGQLTLHLDGEAPTVGKLELTQPEAGGSLSISGFKEMMMGTYFVREGEVTYTHIKGANDQVLKKIAIGNDGVKDVEGKELNHMLVLDNAWTDENWSGRGLDEQVTIVSASDHAKVLLSDGVVLNASQTAIKGEANELHVTGAGTVLMNDASKLSQLAGDATMKVDTTTTFYSEAKMTGALKVGVKEGESSTTLTVTDAGTIASFSSVNLAENTTLANEVAAGHDDSIKALSGSGTLDKTGEGTLAISGDSSEFAGSVNIGSGTLEVQNNMNANTLSGSGKLAKTGTGDMTVKNASGFTGDIEAIQGTLELEGVALTGAKTQKISVSTGATVNLVGMGEGVDGATIELSIDVGTFGVYSGTDAGESNVTGLTLAAGGKIVIGSSKEANVLEANLVTLKGSILDFTSGGQLTMGCDLNVQDGTIVLLAEEKFDGLKNGTLDSVTLFNGIDNTSMDAANLIICRGAEAGAETLTAQVDFQTDGEGHGTLSVTTNVPEPTTGTLSLLALAGLCARRRRK